ncbi:MAG TPA: DNA mismatch repair endonuclease MutL [Geobacteraceae bacterium]
MSARIKILPENLTNKIAAGEVVERPASVVKELVENALDAGATEVTVEIESGGKKLIRVTDNGSGMSREDALLSLERHATSKIATDADLFHLATLGFRGEALPSIASVSRFSLATREAARIEGAEIYAEGGRIKDVKACGMAYGTEIAVRNLFFNTPARLKFLKSTETEAGHVGEFLARLAISRPEVRFTYLSDGRTVFRALNGTLRERAASLLGNSLAADLYPVEFESGGISVSGLVAPPGCSRSAASHLYTYINGRFIRDRVVQHAILQAYRNFMERGRYPVVVLFIQVPPGEVDVNVHPTKHEVRFREQARVHDAIQAAVESVLRKTPWIRAQPVAEAPPAVPSPPQSASSVRVAEVRESLARYASLPQRQETFAVPPPPVARPVVPERNELRAEAGPAGYFSGLTVIGQFNAAYILCQDGTDLVVIDQHAAHERVAFERLKLEFAALGVESQGLLFPETVELSFREAATLAEHAAELTRLGFELEAFGGATWLVKGVPRLVAGRDCLRILRDILEELAGLGKSRTFADAQEEILTRIACHSVVRGSHPLTLPEITALFLQMDTTEFSSNCPHGRPVSRTIGLGEIEKMFKRV